MSEQNKNFVVVQNGQRASQTMTEEEARKEAQRRKKLAETTGQPLGENIEVKQNICG